MRGTKAKLRIREDMFFSDDWNDTFELLSLLPKVFAKKDRRLIGL